MTTALRNPALDDLVSVKGFYIKFYDPAGRRYGFPTFPFHGVPDGLATRRQLRAAGLCPGRQPVVAQILWTHKKTTRVAYLYRIDLAKPKRNPTAAQLAAIGKALAARRTCGTCRKTKNYYIPRSLGECLDCAEGSNR